MASKWFNNDWTLAHFLYYICQISLVLMILYALNLGVMNTIFWIDGNATVDQVPVRMELAKFQEYNDVESAGTGIHISNNVEGNLRLSSEEGKFKKAIISSYLSKIVLWIRNFAVLFLFMKILKTIIDEKPFHENNPRYLFSIGWILFLSPLLSLLFNWIAHSFFQNLSLPEEVTLQPVRYFDDNLIIVGIAIIVLRYVLKEGSRIYEEQKLTV